MNDISLLKELGLSEVARKTHIEIEYLGYIADKNFEKLARFNVKGFIKILERELDIDFTQWMSEYEAFVSERSQNSEHKSISVSPKISAYTADGGHSNAGLKFLVLTLVLVVAGVIYMLSENNYFNGILNIFEDKNIKVIYTAPSLDTKVCSLQTKQLNEAAKKYPNVKFYSVTVDTPFAQERFCTANEINGLKAVSDFKYHQFGIQNGFFVKEKGLLTRALTILDENNTVKYIEYVSEEGKEADVEKALKFLENNLLKK